ncbi:hypothetical protein [Pedobacter sp. BMA]|uniref:hypothetical protein n=1 Tax=Pedobacter sp. BMA TaxID=1663685 RepID=UPI00069EAB2D|nr:hypothetical protein [Pedobacter sp. BMA]
MKPYTVSPLEARNRNMAFESDISSFLCAWMVKQSKPGLLRFDQDNSAYLENDALRDFFISSENPMGELLSDERIFLHLNRPEHLVYFDSISGDPLLSRSEQRIYNLARRMEHVEVHIPFRSVQPNKQTEVGDIADIETYPEDSAEVRYNSGNHFASRPANANVFIQNSQFSTMKSEGNLHVLFKNGFLEDRLQEIRSYQYPKENLIPGQLLFFVICSRHSITEGHFGTSLVIIDPQTPEFPKRILICDTLLKQLPQHPRWWHHFVNAYSNVFGDAANELIEDVSHPLQKVNIKGDDPFRHDWDCPYYAAALADAFSGLVKNNVEVLLHGSSLDVHIAMRQYMSEYYDPTGEIKPRSDIQFSNRIKRWRSGQQLIGELRNGQYHVMVNGL